MKKLICALLIFCLIPMTFFASCGDNDKDDFNKPVFGECEQIEFKVSNPRSGLANIVKKVITDKEDISRIVNYVNNAELTFAEELYTGLPVGGYGILVTFIDKDGGRRSISVGGDVLHTGDVPYYIDENFEDDLLQIYYSIDVEEKIVF